MKKNRITFVILILFSINSFAQSPKVIKDAYKNLDKYEILKDSLAAKCKALETKLIVLNNEIKELSKRDSISNNKKMDELIAEIKGIKSLEEFHQNNEWLKNELNKYSKEEWATAYIKMLDMNESLFEGYSDKNEKYVKQLNIVQNGLFSVHKGLFSQLSDGINDYKFIMSELIRVFDLVDAAYQQNNRISYQALFQKLDDDHETDYIKEVDWSNRKLMEYIKAKVRGRDTQYIRTDVIGRCPEAKAK